MKKGKNIEPQSDVNAWMITFSDLLTLMLTFFVLLISMSTLDNKRIKEIFGPFPGAMGPMEMGASGEVGRYYVLPPKTLAEEGTSITKRTEEIKIRKKLSEIRAKKGKTQEFYSRLQKIASTEGMDIQHRKDQLNLKMQERLLFQSGSARLKTDGENLLMRLCDVLANEEYKLLVEGHADDRPIHTDRYPSNWELSLARAVSVVRFMAERGGMNPQRLSAVGYESTRNLFPNDTEEHRSLNRRVEIVMKKIKKAKGRR